MKERQWQAIVMQTARALGWRVYHTHDSRGSVPGYPDLTLVRERIVFAELKTDTGRVSPAQKEWLAALEAAGVECYLWRPRDRQEVDAVLSRQGRAA